MYKHINDFITKLNTYQTLVSKKSQSNLIEEWRIQPKSKKNRFYKIYRELRKNELLLQNKRVLKHCWRLSPLRTNRKKASVYKKQIRLKSLDFLNEPVFYKKHKMKNFERSILKGYTSYGERIKTYNI